MVGTMVRQLTEGATIAGIDAATLAPYYVDHGVAVYPANAAGVPFTAAYLQSKGDPRTDLYENMAAEQKARSTYEYLINMADDPDVIGPLKFLREREIVHFQRFGEALRIVEEYLESKKQFKVPNYKSNVMSTNMGSAGSAGNSANTDRGIVSEERAESKFRDMTGGAGAVKPGYNDMKTRSAGEVMPKNNEMNARGGAANEKKDMGVAAGGAGSKFKDMTVRGSEGNMGKYRDLRAQGGTSPMNKYGKDRGAGY
ncbi:MAG: hypothetical protein GXX89_04575 [Clostridiales bacterium]|nr:hypothetical protein [Clostridiales bacterium]